MAGWTTALWARGVEGQGGGLPDTDPVGWGHKHAPWSCYLMVVRAGARCSTKQPRNTTRICPRDWHSNFNCLFTENKPNLATWVTAVVLTRQSPTALWVEWCQPPPPHAHPPLPPPIPNPPHVVQQLNCKTRPHLSVHTGQPMSNVKSSSLNTRSNLIACRIRHRRCDRRCSNF